MTLPLRSVIVMLVLVLAAAVAGAGSIYRWVDQDGVVHYGNEAPQGGAIGDIQTRPEVEGSSAAASTSEAVPGPESSATPPAAAPRQTVDVEIYTTSWCGYCREAKQYFRSRGIAFREFDVEKDPAAARRLKRYNPRGGVPVTVIDGQPIIGYAPAAFASALAK